MKASEAIARILKQERVEYLFCFPVNSLIEECAKIDIRPIVGRTERTVVNMADGYSRASNGRKIGVVAVQHGPGAENAYAGIAQAFADGSPLLFLPGGIPASQMHITPNFHAASSYSNVAKWSARIPTTARVAPMIRRAFTLLRSGRRAPVVLEVPSDVANAEVNDVKYDPPNTIRFAADPDNLKSAIQILRSAKRPVIHAGQGVLWAEACDELREFAERTAVPVMTTLTGKSAFPENHPLSLGTGGYAGTGAAAHHLKEADVVVGIGCSFTSTLFGAPIPEGKTIIHVTNDENDVNKDIKSDVVLLGDAKLVLRQLIVEADNYTRGSRSVDEVAADVQTEKRAWLSEWNPRLTSDETPINPYRIVNDLMNTVDRNRTIITHDSGNPRDQLAPFWETLIPRGYIGWGKSTQLGSSLGFALGAKLAHPDKLVVQFLGDTAFGMCGTDFETAAREKIPILSVLINNGTMGGYDRYIPIATEKYRTRYLTGDYCKVAEGFGIVAERISDPSQVIPALKRAIDVTETGTPALVEFITREDPKLSRYW